MKTTEQIKQQIFNYLNKTSQHTFMKPDSNGFTYFKVIKIEDEFFKLENGNLTKINIDNYIKYYSNDAKCVISHNLFLNKKMKSVKSNKYHLGEIEDILKGIK
jgi:hypothetical protein